MPHTPEQAAVIRSGAGNLLVSAAAGSGKTAVLTERIVQRVAEGRLDIRQVLVMTFTEAAARQMKDRIETKLRSALAGETRTDGRRLLTRQLSYLPGASISTIHAFCLDVIRNFYSEALDEKGQPLVEPGFTIDDGHESDLLLRETLDDYVNRQYEEIDLSERAPGTEPAEDLPEGLAAKWTEARKAAFFRLMEGYGGSRGDEAVRKQILSLHKFLRSLPDYEDFVRRRLDSLRETACDFSASPYSRALIRMLSLRLGRAAEELPEMKDLLLAGIRFISGAERNRAYADQFLEMIRSLECLSGYLAGGGSDWDTVRSMTESLANLGLPRCGSGDSPEKSRFMELFCSSVAEVVHFLTGACGTNKYRSGFLFEPRVVFSSSSADIEADLADMLPSLEMLFELVLGLDREYAAKKRAAGTIDFSDFEHLALAILRKDEARSYYRRRFSEIYVDEYQDTSSIQDEIINAISGGNCLLVGDIKQSIYRFRHARPRLFLEKAAAYGSGAGGSLQELNKNFRSVPGILDAANFVFSQLMSPGAGEINYDGSQALLPHRPADPAVPAPVSLLLVNRQGAAAAGGAADGQEPDSGGDLDHEVCDGIPADDSRPPDENAPADDAALAEELSRDRQEALAVISQMAILHDQGCSWHDMVVLARTREIGRCYREQLETYGIPAWLPADESFLDHPVLRQMASLVDLLDNRRQDIPLAAVMRSEMVSGGFSIGEMARIRLETGPRRSGQIAFHAAADEYAEKGRDPALRDKLREFFRWLESLREKEQVVRLGELIGQIYAETGWLDRLAARRDGALQIRKLRQFQQWAELFEKTRQRGLYAFARFLENIRDSGSTESPFGVDAVSEDVVRILTIHASKGLEFPVVFLAGTGYGLVPRDSKDSVLISESLGIGMDFADPELQIRYPSHLKLAMLEEIKAAGIAEEMRLLYVAMTRAVDRLYIAGTVKAAPGTGDPRLSEIVRQTRKYGQLQLPDHLVLSGRNYLEWLFMALARQPGLDLSWLDNGLAAGWIANFSSWTLTAAQIPDLVRQLSCWTASRAASSSAAKTSTAPQTQEIEAYEPDGHMAGGLYRYGQAAAIPAKISVSELKRQSQAWENRLNDEPRGISLTMRLEDARSVPPGEAASRLPDIAGDRPEDETAASELGTALHAFLRLMDLPSACRNPAIGELERQLDAMRSHQMLSRADALLVAPFMPQVLAFVKSDLAGEMSAAYEATGRRIYQEMPFTLSVPAAEIFPGRDGIAPDDHILVQGIIDCWFENEDGITLIDFKTDRLPEDPARCLPILTNRYGTQISYYARAIQASVGKPVKRRLICLVRQGKVYEMPS
jgi:ATP-dependent helicase/nuclease subunit A